MDRDLGRHLLDPETRSPDPSVCPFLRSVRPSADGSAQDPHPPIAKPDDDNRCFATGSDLTQDFDQQRLVCLTAVHVVCRLYLRGAADGPLPPTPWPPTPLPLISPPVATKPYTEPEPFDPTLPVTALSHPGHALESLDEATESGLVAAGAGSGSVAEVVGTEAARAAGAEAPGHPEVTARAPRLLTPAVFVAMAILIASASLAIAFVAARGGLELPSASNAATQASTARPTPVLTPGPVATAEPTAASTPTSAPVVTPIPTTPPTTPPTPSPTPASDRYAVLVACPATPDCYLYTIRAGDNLQSIARWFGVPYATVLALNPGIVDAALIQPGDVITLPPPTR